jgi:hypothetical protein
MSVTIRDNEYHTYADYLIWSRTSGDELIEVAIYRLADGVYGNPLF